MTWRSIKDDPPPMDGEEFLACYSHQGNVMCLVRWNRVHNLWFEKGGFLSGFEANATHWMPLPEPPDA